MDSSPLERRLSVAARFSRDAIWVVVGFIVLGALLAYFSPVIVPIVLAAIFAAVLAPVANRIEARGASRAMASLGALLVGLLALVALFLLVAIPFVRRASAVLSEAKLGVGSATRLADEHGVLTTAQAEVLRKWLITHLGDALAILAQGAVAGVSTIVTVGTTMFLTLPLVFFMLKDADRIWSGWMVRVPGARRPRVDAAGRTAATTLAAFLRGTSIVALFDAVVVAIGLTLIGVPLVVPLAVLTFSLAFIPTIGAVLAGAVASLVALAAGGIGDCLLVILLSLLVNQLEGVIVAPFAVGRAVSLHPAAVLISVTTGTVIAGIAGAFLAVPTVAVTAAIVRALRGAGTAVDVAPLEEPALDPATPP